jgi:uncharacterized protein (TIGR00299 family) protein
VTAERELPAAALRGATLYFDCYAGIAGDMTLAALLDLGVPEAVVRQSLSQLGLPGWELRVYPTRKGVLVATKVEVDVLRDPPAADPHPAHPHHHDGHHHGHTHEVAPAADAALHAPAHSGHPHRHYAEIRQLIAGSKLDADVIHRALQMFDRIAEVEAALHGVPVAEVAFHEVGAVDSIIDIVGVAAALSWLQPRRVVARPVALGSGTVRTAHGLLPVPAPATLALLKGAQVESGGPTCELTTPTGAAILAVHATEYGPLPAMRVLGIGHGAGTRELADRPNVLRVIAGQEEPQSSAPSSGAGGSGEQCVVLETNIDDMNPQLYEPLLESLLSAGARDVWLTPIQMKKGRPGVLVGVLCDPPARDALTERLLRESTSLGVRTHLVTRAMLARELVQVQTEFGDITVKLGREPRSGELWNVAPEYESCRARAREHGVPVKRVYAAAQAASYALHATTRR